MARDRRDPRTLDLFDPNWLPPVVARTFEAVKIRAASLRSTISKGVALALKECGKPREQAAREISEYLGESCSEPMLNNYAAEGKEDHVINVVRFVALIHVTRDMRLLNMIAQLFGWAVIDAKYLPAIEDAIIADKIEELSARQKVARCNWRGPR